MILSNTEKLRLGIELRSARLSAVEIAKKEKSRFSKSMVETSEKTNPVAFSGSAKMMIKLPSANPKRFNSVSNPSVYEEISRATEAS